MSVRSIDRRIAGGLALLLGVAGGPAVGQAQLFKKKNAVVPCFVRPDCDSRSPLGVSLPAVGCAVRSPAPPLPTNRGPIGAGRGLGFGSLFGAATLPPRVCAPQSICYVPPAPVCIDRPAFWYPSSNLSTTWAPTAFTATPYVNVVLTPSPAPSFPAEPTGYAPPAAPAPPAETYAFRSTSTPREKVDRAPAPDRVDFARLTREPAPQVNDVAPPALSAGQARELADALDRGDEHFRRADYLAAREEYTRALVIAGEEPGVRIPFGLAEFALGRYADASRAMRQSVSRPPILDPSSIDLRQAYARPAEFEAQLRTLESFIGRNPFDADALFLLGFLKACTNNPVGARAVFEKYLALREADPAARPFALGLTRRGP